MHHILRVLVSILSFKKFATVSCIDKMYYNLTRNKQAFYRQN